MLSEQLSPQQKEDGLALKAMLGEPKIRAALDRVMGRMERSLFDRFERDKEKKSWLRGARAMLQDFMPALLQMVEDSDLAAEEEAVEQKLLRGESADGSSDLALG